MATELQQAILDSVKLISEKAVDGSNATVTVKGEIVDVIDPALRQYKVKFGGAEYKDCYAIANTAYDASTIVYLLIPDGNFDSTKVILGMVDPSQIAEKAEDEVEINILVEDNLIPYNKNIELSSWINEIRNIDIKDIRTSFTKKIEEYLKKYKQFSFSAFVKTSIDKDHQAGGNYGLKLQIPFKVTKTGEEVIKTCYLDVTNMQGNPYNYQEYQHVYTSIEIDDTLEYNTEKANNLKLIAFVDGFGYTQELIDVFKDENKKPDIFIKDLSFQPIQVLTEAERTGYYLAVVSNRGNYFLDENSSNKILSPILKLNGKQTKTASWDCYWFVEDSSIGLDSEYYSTYGGLGWKCLNKRTNVVTDTKGKQTFQYILNKHSYEVSFNDVISSLEYKCVLTKDGNTVSNTIVLQNLKPKYIIELESLTGSNTYTENIGDVTLIARIRRSDYKPITDTMTTVWQRFDKDGNYLDNNFYTVNRLNDKKTVVIDEETTHYYYETEISFACNLIEKMNIINCTFFVSEKTDNDVVKRNIGTETLSIDTTTEQVYRIGIEGGDQLYKYDVDGDSPLVATYDGPASSAIKECPPISFRLFKPDGKELTETEYSQCIFSCKFPTRARSMMVLTNPKSSDKKVVVEKDGYYLFNLVGRQTFSYTIVEQFNKKRNDNVIYVTAKFDGVEVNDTVPITFLKDGMGGTNGSKYAAVIKFGVANDRYGYGESDDSGKKRKFQMINVANTWYWYHGVRKEIENDLEVKGIKNEIHLMSGNFPCGSVPSSSKTPYFDVKVYKDGEVITSGYSIEWSMFDYSSSIDETGSKIDATNPCFKITSSNFSIRDNNWIDKTSNIVQAKVTIEERSETNSKEVVYTYYPIEITKLGSLDKFAEKDGNIYVNNIIPNLDGGFEEVVYASDGTNPSFDNTNPFSCVDDTTGEPVPSDLGYSYTWSVSEATKEGSTTVISNLVNKKYINPSTSQEVPSKRKITPTTKFDNGVSKNYVRLDMKLEGTGAKRLSDKIKDLEKEKKKYDDEIKINNEIKTYLHKFIKSNEEEGDDPKQSLNYYEREDTLRNADGFLEVRQVMLACINILSGLITDPTTSDYFDEAKIKIKNQKEEEEIVSFNKNDTINALNNALNNIYSVCTSEADSENLFGHLVDLHKYEIVNIEEILLVKQNALNQWNNYISTYTSHYNELKTNDKLYNQAQNLYSLNIFILNFYKTKKKNNNDFINENLKKLIELDSSFEGWQDSLERISKKLYTPSDKISSYNDYMYGILLEIKSFLNVYIMSPSKIDYIYDTKIKECNDKKAEVDKQLEPLLEIQKTNEIVHIKPIVMLFNRYELANINGWDGNKLYTDQEGRYILAPQVGAGLKKNGTFTGVVMGVKQVTKVETGASIEKLQTGLFGYSNGIQSFCLDSEDGSASFGKSGAGQIIIDPAGKNESGLIYSGSYFNSDGQTWINGKPNGYKDIGIKDTHEGMLINLTKNYIHFGKAGTNGEADFGRIYSGGHTSLNDTTHQGFYLSHRGLSILSIKDGNASGIVIKTDEEPVIYSNGHNTIDSTKNGFYLGPEGFSISNGEYEKNNKKYRGNAFVLRMNPDGDEAFPVIYSNQHDSLGSSKVGYYIGPQGFSITGEGEDPKTGNKTNSSIKVDLQDSYPTIQANNHTFDSSRPGFYLGPHGFSIANVWTEDDPETPGGKISVKSGFTVSLDEHFPKIYSNGHDDIGSTRPGFYLGQNGLEILSDTKGKIVIKINEDPKIYTGRHTNLGNYNNGFYIGYDGISIHNFFRVSASCLEVGHITNSDPDESISEQKKWWVIGKNIAWPTLEEPDPHIEQSFIGYNANRLYFDFYGDNMAPKIYDGDGQAQSNSIYIGVDGIRLGKNFAIDKKGRLYGKDTWLEGEIRAKVGYIGFDVNRGYGWKIDGKAIEGFHVNASDKYIRMDPDGDITVKNTGNYGTWSLKNDGTMIVDSINSSFGGNFIVLAENASGEMVKSSIYDSQAIDSQYNRQTHGSRGPFRGTCIDVIKILAREALHGMPVIEDPNNPGSLIVSS